VWANLKRHIRKAMPKDLNQLKLAINSFCQSKLTKEHCIKYVSSLKEVYLYFFNILKSANSFLNIKTIKRVIDAKGKWSDR
jgi:hypothetical protein